MRTSFEYQKRICWKIWKLYEGRKQGCIVRVDTGLGKTYATLYTLYNMYRLYETGSSDGDIMSNLCGPTVSQHIIELDDNLPVIMVQKMAEQSLRELSPHIEGDRPLTAFVEKSLDDVGKYRVIIKDLNGTETNNVELSDHVQSNIDSLLNNMSIEDLEENGDEQQQPQNDEVVTRFVGYDKPFTVLILVPGGLISQWKLEMEEHLNIDSSLIYVYHKKNRTIPTTARFVLSTVETLLSDLKKERMDSPVRMRWEIMVIDEIHKRGNVVNNNEGDNPKYKDVLLEINRTFTIGLTATPYGKSINNIKSLIEIIGNPTINDIPTSFMPTEKDELLRLWKYFTIDYDLPMVNEFNDVRTSDRFVIPSVTHDVKYFDIDRKSKYWEDIEKFEKDIRKLIGILKERGYADSIDIKTQLDGLRSRYRLYCNTWQSNILAINTNNDNSTKSIDARIYTDDVSTNLYINHPKHNYIYNYLRSLFESISNSNQTNNIRTYRHHVVITSESIEMLGHLKSMILRRMSNLRSFHHTGGNIRPNSLHVYTYTGALNQTQKSWTVDSFNQNPYPSILLLGKSAGMVGLNLFSGSMIVCEPSFKFSDDVQVIGRIRRLGQQHPVNIIYLALRDTIEENIRKTQWIQANKSNMFMSIISRDDLLGMFTTEEQKYVQPLPSSSSSSNRDPLYGLYTINGGLGEPGSRSRTLKMLEKYSSEDKHVYNDDVDPDYKPPMNKYIKYKCSNCNRMNDPSKSYTKTKLCDKCEEAYDGKNKRRRIGQCESDDCYASVSKLKCKGCDSYLDSWTCDECKYSKNLWGDQTCQNCGLIRNNIRTRRKRFGAKDF